MIEFLSYGDKLKRGIYHRHSRFKTVVNFVSSENRLISLVCPNIGPGPSNIEISADSIPGSPWVLTVADKGIYLDNLGIFPYDGFTKGIYKSHFSNYLGKTGESKNQAHPGTKIIKNIGCWEEHLLNRDPGLEGAGKSLLFLLKPEYEEYFKSGFDKAFCQRAKDAVTGIFSENYLEGVKKLKGIGCGLTPGGDDFISGLLVALNLVEWLEKTDLQSVMEAIHDTAVGTNLISNTFISQSRDGNLFHKFNTMIALIFSGREDKESIRQAAEQLAAVGETSGLDMSTGFLMGITRRNVWL
ncbi:MAG: DUF2877 domain-containing protein [bacterium]|nr:DUF2877 domain-containing protein [bacterium]